jgi:hypothetical protein
MLMPPKKAEDRHSGAYTRRASPLTGLQRLSEIEGRALMPSSTVACLPSQEARWGLKGCHADTGADNAAHSGEVG